MVEHVTKRYRVSIWCFLIFCLFVYIVWIVCLKSWICYLCILAAWGSMGGGGGDVLGASTSNADFGRGRLTCDWGNSCSGNIDVASWGITCGAGGARAGTIGGLSGSGGDVGPVLLVHAISQERINLERKNDFRGHFWINNRGKRPFLSKVPTDGVNDEATNSWWQIGWRRLVAPDITKRICQRKRRGWIPRQHSDGKVNTEQLRGN